MKHKLERDSDDLGWGVGRVPCGGVVNRIFDLNNQGLERLIAVVGSTYPLAVVLESGGGNVSVGSIEMIKQCSSGRLPVADVLVTERSDVQFVYRRQQKLTKGFVRVFVLGEDLGGFGVMIP